MLFSSTVFLYAFLPCMMALYFPFCRTKQIKNIILLAGSLFFYAWGERKFVLVMLASIVYNYFIGLLLGLTARHGWRKRKKAVLVCGLAGNLGLLFVYKYLGFAGSILARLFPLGRSVPEIALPIGISFFTFQSMSYLIDVYRGDAAAQKNPVSLALYIALFPQLIAGPIVRYGGIAEQISCRRETWDGFCTGLCRFCTGLCKKVLIANNMGLIADRAHTLNAAGELDCAMAWLGAFAYTLEIYYDFSGYSDMALGLGSIFGFTFGENFDYPYCSSSVTEFWRRWHISLGTWFRDYVYIPLGGSRVSKGRLVFNLAVVWTLTGIWHGASWNFVLWGILYFVLLTAEKLLFGKNARAEEKTSPLSRFAGWLYTVFFVNLGWVLFRAETLPDAGRYLGVLFGLFRPEQSSSTALLFLWQKRLWFVLALLFCAPVVPYLQKKLDALRSSRTAARLFPLAADILYPPAMVLLFAVCTAYLLKETYNPFIYFHF